jgi:hypothetical protein
MQLHICRDRVYTGMEQTTTRSDTRTKPATVPPKQWPMRAVVRTRVPDARYPIIQDLFLECGHTLAARSLKRGKDRRFHRPTRMRCPLCVSGAHASGRTLPTGTEPRMAPRTGDARPTTAQPETMLPTPAEVRPGTASITRPGTGRIVSPPAPEHEFSPRDLAARNWE